jgi:hypothetical protein
MTDKLQPLFESIETTIADYRAEEGFKLDAHHVKKLG